MLGIAVKIEKMKKTVKIVKIERKSLKIRGIIDNFFSSDCL